MREEMTGSVNETPKNKYRMSSVNETTEKETSVNETSADVEKECIPESSYTVEHPSYDQPSYNQPSYNQAPVVDDTVVVKNKGFQFSPIVILVAVAVLVMGVLLVKDIFHKEPGTLDGQYEFAYAEADGREVSPEEARAWGVDAVGMTMDINGDSAVVTLHGVERECDLEVVGDEITLTRGDKVITGKVDLYEETITMEMNSGDVIFEKI